MSTSPFKLLDAYGAKDKAYFFGREMEIYSLYNLIQKSQLTLLYGASGTGKTSLINAGLPKVFKITNWFKVSIRRSDNINKSLRNQISRLLGRSIEDQPIPNALRSLFEKYWIPVYLVFDQFEEIFTLGSEEERAQFFATLKEIMDKNRTVKIILSMREEYIGHLYDYENIIPTIFDIRFRIEPMKDSTIKEVIQKMTISQGIILEEQEDTAEQILTAIKQGKQAAFLPYLQIYLHYLYTYTSEKTGFPITFTQEGIEEIGALGDVLQKYISNKTEDAQTHLTSIGASSDFAATFLDVFATSEGTKQSFLKETLIERLDVSPSLIEAALAYFDTNAKLLRADENEVDRYEPVHDLVAKQIHELRTEESKEYKVFERKLEEDHDRWRKDQKATDRLLTELDLRDVTTFQERLIKDYDEKYQPYIEASRSYLIKREKRNRRVRAAITILSIATFSGLFFSFQSSKKLSVQKDRARAEIILLDVDDVKKNAATVNEMYPSIAKRMFEDKIKELDDTTLKKLRQDKDDTSGIKLNSAIKKLEILRDSFSMQWIDAEIKELRNNAIIGISEMNSDTTGGTRLSQEIEKLEILRDSLLQELKNKSSE